MDPNDIKQYKYNFDKINDSATINIWMFQQDYTTARVIKSYLEVPLFGAFYHQDLVCSSAKAPY